MYLSRVEIDTNNRRKIHDLTHLGAYHNWVESSFPQEFDDGIRSRKLWRIDRINNKNYLLIVSASKPDIKLLERYGVEGSGSYKEYDNYVNSFEKGDKVNFKVTLNPVVSISNGRNRRGRVVPCYSDVSQLEYFSKKAEKHGFKIMDENIEITQKCNRILKKKGFKDQAIYTAIFEGVVIVENESVFKDTLLHGIGRKKAYGCGLMTAIKRNDI